MKMTYKFKYVIVLFFINFIIQLYSFDYNVWLSLRASFAQLLFSLFLGFIFSNYFKKFYDAPLNKYWASFLAFFTFASLMSNYLDFLPN